MAQRSQSGTTWPAERHQLLSHPTRLAIIRALQERPREISELADLAGVHPNTVRSHLHRLHDAGLLEVESVRRGNRGRPTKQYRLLEPVEAGPGLLGDTPRLLMKSIVSLSQRMQGQSAIDVATEEGFRLGQELGQGFALADPGGQQWVVDLHDQLSFAPRARHQQGGMEVELFHCPLGDWPAEENSEVVCSFHLGMLQGAAESVGQDPRTVNLEPFSNPSCCRVTTARQAEDCPD